jgi:hypothetical protein
MERPGPRLELTYDVTDVTLGCPKSLSTLRAEVELMGLVPRVIIRSAGTTKTFCSN